MLDDSPPADTPAAVALRPGGESSWVNTGSPAAHHLLNEWLTVCVLTHESCRRTVSGDVINEDAEPELPKRVIDVFSQAGADYVCLVEARGTRGRYATLSHCWGPEHLRPLTTTTITLPNRLSGIKIKSLPKTFQDAVAVTRAIGLRYLWIDSLCIVQDDHDDWLEQSHLMGAYYEKAHLTIGAADAVSSHQGLFRKSTRKTVEIPYRDKEGKPRGSIFVVEPEPPSRLEGSPLTTRAWVTQELLLSRRFIAFTKYGLLWSCKTRAETEFGPKSPYAIYERLFEEKSLSPFPEGSSSSWDEVVSRYSIKQLTYQSDKLIALQGLANSMQKNSRNKYLSGLWANELPSRLLWSVKSLSDADARRLPKTLNFPSWSWVSVQNPVNPFIPGMWPIRAQPACEVLPVDENTGHLIVKGCLAQAPDFGLDITWHNGQPFVLLLGQERCLAPFGEFASKHLLDDVLEDVNKLPNSLMLCKRKNDTAQMLGWCLIDDVHDIMCLLNDTDDFWGRCSVLRLMRKTYGEDPTSDDYCVYNFVLLLQPCEPGSQIYRRIGMGMICDGRSSNWFSGAQQSQICIA